jgi:HAD superfamily hydrolase (TIGR01549 family)
MNNASVLNQCVGILAIDPISIDSVIFDAFGTLVYIDVRHSPYRKLVNWVRLHGNNKFDDAERLMASPLDFLEVAEQFGADIPGQLLCQWQCELREEVGSVTLYPDALPTLRKLRNMGYRIGVCSNLAMPYGPALRKLLPQMDVYAFSYEVNAVKPEKEIYHNFLKKLGCEAPSVFFVGDTKKADFDGPRSLGMDACLINRRHNNLTMYSTDRITRFGKLKDTAAEMMKNDQAGLEWLSTPIAIFGNKSPLEHAATESGFHDVADLIGRIRHGIHS